MQNFAAKDFIMEPDIFNNIRRSVVYSIFCYLSGFKLLKFYTDCPAVKTTKLLYLFLFSSQLHVARAFETTVYKCEDFLLSLSVQYSHTPF